jgi:hypothetical protein
VELYLHETVSVLPGTRFATDGQDATTAEGAETLSLTAPDRPERLAKVTVPLADGAMTEMDDAEMLKSKIVTGRTMEWVSDPLAALKVTV